MAISSAIIGCRWTGKSGLGLEAPRAAVTDYLYGDDWTLLDEFAKVEFR